MRLYVEKFKFLRSLSISVCLSIIIFFILYAVTDSISIFSVLVVLSWVSFFLNREATADRWVISSSQLKQQQSNELSHSIFRISLGITTVLTMTFLGLEARTDLPKVSYPTALDFFVFLSFAFIFATILQYAFVHYFTKYGSGECYYDFWDDSDESDTEENNLSRMSSLTQIDAADAYGVIPLSRIEIKITEEGKTARALRIFRSFILKYLLCYTSKNLSECDEDEYVNSSHHHAVDLTLSRSEPSSLSASITTPNTPQSHTNSTGHIDGQVVRRNLRRNFNSVSKIDKFSRVAFPFSFLLINMFYWIFYLSRSQRK